MLKTLPLPMTVVMCGGRRGDLKTLLVWYCSDLELPCPKYSKSFAKIRYAAFKFVSLRPKSHQIAPHRYWTQTYCLREQTHSNEFSFRIRLTSQIYSIRKASSKGFAYV